MCRPLNFNKRMKPCNFTLVGMQSISIVPQSCIVPVCGQSTPSPRPDSRGLLSPRARQACWPSSRSGPDWAFHARGVPKAPAQGLHGLGAGRLCRSLPVRAHLTVIPAPRAGRSCGGVGPVHLPPPRVCSPAVASGDPCVRLGNMRASVLRPGTCSGSGTG